MRPKVRPGSPNRCVALSALMLVLSLAAVSYARPGGGGSFRGGGSHGSSRSGGSGGGWSGGGGSSSGGATSTDSKAGSLEFGAGNNSPWYAWAAVAAMLVGFTYVGIRVARGRSTPKREAAVFSPRRDTQSELRKALERIREHDEEFSVVLFEDFLYALYPEVQRARGRRNTKRLSAYLDSSVTTVLDDSKLKGVSEIILGAMSLRKVDLSDDSPRVTVRVRFETNYTERDGSGRHGVYAVDDWTLTRAKNAISRSRERVGVFDCPSCGAPQTAVIAGHCNHCNQRVSSGDFDWVVIDARTMSRELRSAILTSDAAETRSEPTLYASDRDEKLKELEASDPGFSVKKLKSRVRRIFARFQKAWSSRDLTTMQPYLSERFLHTQTAWIKAYERAKLRNEIGEPRISKIQIVRVTNDKRFNAVTVRIFASSFDTTVEDGSGRVVVGNPLVKRAYTEYWTLIRGVARNGGGDTKACPKCGGPLGANMTEQCPHCSVKVVSSDFDWVLSRIEQDEVYEG